MLPRPSRVLVTNPDRQLPCHFSKTVLRIPSTRTHPAKSHIRQCYVQQGVPRRERSVFLCLEYDEPVPPAIGKLAFAQRSGAMKAPVGLLSDRTVLRKQDGGALPRQVTVVLPHCSSRQESPGRMPVPDVRWLHRGKGKCLWTFSFCSNAHSFDDPQTV